MNERAKSVLQSADPVAAARAAADDLIQSSDGSNTLAASRLAHLRRCLKRQRASQAVIDAAKRASISVAANAERDGKFRTGDRSRVGIVPPPRFELKPLMARLAALDTKKQVTKDDVLDVITALSLRPSEVATIQITPSGVTGFAKGRGDTQPRPYVGLVSPERASELLEWVRNGIRSRHIPNPSLKGSNTYIRMIKPLGITPKDLRAIGSHYVSQGAATDSQRMVLRRLALRHADIRATAADRYGVVRLVPEREETLDEVLDTAIGVRPEPSAHRVPPIERTVITDPTLDELLDRILLEE